MAEGTLRGDLSTPSVSNTRSGAQSWRSAPAPVSGVDFPTAPIEQMAQARGSVNLGPCVIGCRSAEIGSVRASPTAYRALAHRVSEHEGE